jgi:hypothetical protein
MSDRRLLRLATPRHYAASPSNKRVRMLREALVPVTVVTDANPQEGIKPNKRRTKIREVKMWKSHMAWAIAFAAMFASPCQADTNKVWAEQSIGRASTNWDLPHQRTNITEVYLQVVGPSDLPKAVGEAVGACASKSLFTAYQTFEGTIGEPATKTAAAAGAFKISFLACIKLASLATAVANKFNLSLAHRDHWESGIFGSGTIENPTAAAVDKLIVQNAPTRARKLLSQANQILNRPYTLSVPVKVVTVGHVPVFVPVPQPPQSPVPLSIGGHKFF